MRSPAGPILVIGRNGQLALSIAALGRPDTNCVGRPEADLADPAKLAELIARMKPRLVLNAGGFTKVDPAESQTEEAFILNRDGPAHLARLCAAADIPLIHVSTDCVFDGRKQTSYAPDDVPQPLSAYGRSSVRAKRRLQSTAANISSCACPGCFPNMLTISSVLC